jgi:hypothetical protein
MVMSKQDYCIIPVVYTRHSVRHHEEMREWLMENIDPECYDAEDWRAVDHNWRQRRIWFSNEKDAVMFALKWL